MIQRQTGRARFAAAGLVAAGLVLVACGSDNKTSSTTAAATTAAPDTSAAATTAAPGTSAEAATTVAAGSGMASADAMARVDTFRKAVETLPFNEPVKVEKGKKLFYVQCSVPVCAEIAIGIKAAVEAAGWTFATASHQDTPDTVASAFDAAIAAKPDVVTRVSGSPRSSPRSKPQRSPWSHGRCPRATSPARVST